jgi:streptomycin 3"-adenylyltransferase
VNGDQAAAAVAAMGESVSLKAIVAIYLYGSAIAGGLRPDSDLDLALVTARRLTALEKERLFRAIRPLSRRSLRPARWRPLEVTVLALPDVRPWRYPARVDAQYGEWLTDAELGEQSRRGPAVSADVAILITMLRQASQAYHGPPARDVLDPVPHADRVRATLDAIPDLFADLEGDTRNVLLTLARMWTTTATGTIRSKDDAAEWAADRLGGEDRRLLDQARALYVAGGWGDWAPTMADVRRLADRLCGAIRDAAAAPGNAAGRRV